MTELPSINRVLAEPQPKESETPLIPSEVMILPKETKTYFEGPRRTGMEDNKILRIFDLVGL